VQLIGGQDLTFAWDGGVRPRRKTLGIEHLCRHLLLPAAAAQTSSSKATSNSPRCTVLGRTRDPRQRERLIPPATLPATGATNASSVTRAVRSQLNFPRPLRTLHPQPLAHRLIQRHLPYRLQQRLRVGPGQTTPSPAIDFTGSIFEHASGILAAIA
jgi:hypothetical protein